ncbi:ligase-associated DNA damage response exonuclease [Gemmata sp. G18]|uniref:Ligase-associated DNA damage response exonuclease n=1 Tax=Gemmata palustris TaxID=2822762 RepID=A0ABS5BQP2_9BACT|nr:ligase-associated DNA damage response exonuclease [Gemmata palustris]MBP3955625.1 ligase-associated DNA damage response exonuclease [Gemmata palustris]
MSVDLITLSEDGLYCPAGGFHIDPWNAVPRAVLTHAHSDHARWGCGKYLVAAPGRHLFRTRLGTDADITAVPHGEPVDHNGVRVSFHPAGHVLGSAQIRLEHRGEVWVVTGDYKLDPDPTCLPFEHVRCHTFITESTFALPVYRWERADVLFGGVNAWWRANKAAGACSIVYAYALGKAQRVMAGVDAGIGPIYTHGAVEKVTRAYRDSGVALPPTRSVSEVVTEEGSKGKGKSKAKPWAGALVIAPPSADGSPWAKKFGPKSEAFASGWMCVRGARRRRAVDRGFVLSDHADWPGLLTAVRESGAGRVLATHGFASVLARHLRERGLGADVIATRYGDDAADAGGEGEA